jgi:hypothetical protein
MAAIVSIEKLREAVVAGRDIGRHRDRARHFQCARRDAKVLVAERRARHRAHAIDASTRRGPRPQLVEETIDGAGISLDLDEGAAAPVAHETAQPETAS